MNNQSEPKTKPPLGIEPEHIWKQKRAFALVEAIARYSIAGMSVRAEWLSELGELLGELFPPNAEELERDLTEIKRWKREAMIVMSEWEAVWVTAGSPGTIGGSKAVAMRKFLENSQTDQHVASTDLFGIWQNIETAPRDGSVFLAFVPHDQGGFAFAAVITTDGRLACMMSGDAFPAATQWMPLPSLPNVQEHPTEEAQ